MQCCSGFFNASGNVGFSSGMKDCYLCYDTFLQMLNYINNKAQRLVPIVVAVGSQDVGFN